MSSLCGWVGHKPVDTEGAKAVASGMLARSHLESAGVGGMHVGPGIAVASGGRWSSASVDPGGICAAFAGRAHWSNAELQRVATDRGLAASVIDGYRQFGRALLDHLHGVFALAIAEPDRETALIAVDRLGIGTLSYAAPQEGFVFGSRADAVARHPWLDGAIDPQGVFNYLFFHMVPAPGTIFKGVRKLLPAQFAIYRDGKVETGFYWQLQYHDHPNEPAPELTRRFRAILPQVVQRARGEDDVATFLSGGTDSSTVTGILAQLKGSPVDAYSIGFEAEGFDEMEYARIAAQRFKVRHHSYYVTPADVLGAIPLVARSYDEPFGNASAVPTYYCAKLAKEDGFSVMLAGDGGDEIFGGNARYAKQKVFEPYSRLPQVLRVGLLEPLARMEILDRLPGVSKAISYVRQARVPLPDRLEAYNFVLREGASAILEPDFLAAVSPEQPLELMREVYGRTRSRAAVNRMMHLDLQQTLADNDLRKVTRMCEVAGIDVRYPLLDEEMVTFSGFVPPSQKVKGLRLRHFFKEALRDFLPIEIIEKEKHGFGLPFGVWLREDKPLYELAGDSLNAFRSRGFLRPTYIDALFEHHRARHASYYGVMVWVVMMLEQWLEHAKG